jgi:hypothetical protein
MTEAISYFEPTQESGRALVMRGIRGEIVMLNLLRFREVADYSANPELAPETPISGAEAYDRYVAHSLPYLRKSGGEILLMGEGGHFLIGPEGERWDRALLVRQKSIGGLHGLRRERGLSRGHRPSHRRGSGHAASSAC